MKILISNDSDFAHKYIREGFGKALSACGHDVVIWDIRKKSAFDMFDEFSPDIFVGQTYNVDKAVFKCIEERPWMSVAMKGSDWGVAQDEMDLNKFPVLVANQREVETILELKRRTGKPDFIDIHYHQSSVELTHSKWINNGIKCVGLMSAADISDYHDGKRDERLVCDIGYVGGYWPYKSHTINSYLIPLCHPKEKYNIKIFGNQPWGVPQYCGFIQTKDVKNLFVSAKICPNISEPHSQVYGHDVVERPFKLLSSKAFMITDSVKSMKDNVFGNDVIYAESPEDFKTKIDYYLTHEDERLEMIEKGYNNVMNNHTYFHRAVQFFNELGFKQEADKCLDLYNKYKETLQ